MKNILTSIILILIGCSAIAAQTSSKQCPELQVIGPEDIAVIGEKIVFTAKVSNYTGSVPLRYQWMITRGVIHSGQNTETIQVLTTPADNSANLSAVVKVSGLPAGCPNEASELTGVYKEGLPRPIDRFGEIPKDVLRERIANLFQELKKDPGAVAIIGVSFNRKEAPAKRSRYLKYLYGKFVSSKKDLSRISFSIGEDDYLTETTFWVTPKGADLSLQGIDGSNLIKSDELKTKIKTGSK